MWRGRVLIVAGSAAVTWVVVASGVAASLGNSRPELAVRVSPFDATASTRLAERLVISNGTTAAKLDDGEQLIRRSLARDAAQPVAWRTLALILEARKAPGGPRLMAFSERLSRRDVATQLALIEQDVQRGRVAAALTHYDIALRIAPRTDALLLPILAGATGDPNVRAPLARLVSGADAWRRRFFGVLDGSGVSPSVQADFLAEVRRNGPLPEGDIHRSTIRRLAESGEAASAWRIAIMLDGPTRWAPLIRHGNFGEADTTPPLDWALDSGGAVEGVVETQAGPSRLSIISSNGDAGRVAHQLVRLVPGAAYRLSARAGPSEVGDTVPFYVALHCGSVAGPAPFASTDVIPARPVRVSLAFRVPDRCTAQWLEIGARLGRSDTPAESWITDIAITRSPI